MVTKGTVHSRGGADRSSLARLPLESRGRFPALRLAVIYAFFGALWILVSDRLSFYLVPNIQRAERLQTYKGWFFIAVTSVLLWLLLKRFLSQVRAAEEALHRLNRKLQAIRNCNQSLLRATDEQSLLEEICRIVCEEAGYRMAWVGYAEHDEAKSVRPVAWTGTEEGYLASLSTTWADRDRGSGPTGTAIRSGKSCCIQDFATDPRLLPWRENVLQHGYRSGIALPLKDEHDNAFGSLTIYSAQPNAMTSEEIRLLEELAGDLAFGIVTLRSGAARKRAEEALRESEAFLREQANLLNLTHDTIFVMDMEGVVKYWNRGAEERYGWPAEQAIGKVVHGLLKTVFPAPLDEIKAEATDTGCWEGELVHTRKDGTQVLVASRWALQRDKSGTPVAILETNNDITERKRAEEEVRDTAAQWQATFDAVQDLVLLLDKDFRILRANRATAEFMGLPFDKILGGHCYDLIHRTPLPSAECPLAKMRRSRRHEEAEILAREGGPWLSVSVDPLFDASGELIQVVHVARDITEHRQAEQALRLSEANLNRAQQIAHIGSWHLDVSCNRLSWSDEVFRIFGVPIGTALTYEAFLDRVHPADRESVHNAWSAALQGAPYDIEHRIIVGGDVKWVREQAQLEFSKDGNPTSGIGTVQDITERKRAEQERHENAERFRAIADYTYDWENWIGIDGKLLWVNPAVERISGYSVGECMAMPDFPIPIVAEADRGAFARQMREAVQGSSRNDFEFRVRHKDGSLVWVAASWQPIYDSCGASLGYRSSIRDIVERKKAEEAVRRGETYLAESQRLSHTGSWAFDVVGNNYVYASEECLRIFELDAQQTVPPRNAVSRLIHPEDRDRVQADFEKLLREKVDTSSEFRIVLPSGPVRDVHVIRHPVLNEMGGVGTVVGTVIDITERKRADEALRESETRFRTFVDHAGDALFVLDLDQGIIIDVNRQACESLGCSGQELVGKTPLAFHLDSDRAEMESAAERAAAGETVFDKHWHRRKDGSLFPVEVNTSSFWHGGRRFLLKVARDISDRVRAEEQREKLRQVEADLAHMSRVSTIGELTASIAHEVNQPLSGIVSSGSACLRWLAANPPNLDEVREAVRRMIGAGKHAGEVIARIRALTKRTAAPKEKLDLNETIREVLVLVGDEAKRNSVILRTFFANDLSPVWGDRIQLQQVVLNLLINGIEAMSNVSERPRDLMITTCNIDTEQVQVTVEDSGMGIDPSSLQKIFEPFYTTKSTGMGMGLSISRSILQQHDGRLWATANDGPGTSFHFALPKYREEEAHARAASTI